MDKAAEMKISVGILDPHVLMTTKIDKKSTLVIRGHWHWWPLCNTDHLYEVQSGLVFRFC
jgi:hypothetical protein